MANSPMKYIAPRLAAILFVCLCPLLSAQTRIFTSTDGRTLEAEVVSATPDMVTLKLANGTTPTVPLERLSELDRTYVSQWRQANPSTIRYNFNVEFSKQRTSGPRQRPRGDSPAVVVSKEKWVGTFKIQNRSGQAVDNLEVRYQLHYMDDNGKVKAAEIKTGTRKIPIIKSNEILSIDTDTLELEVTQLAAGYYWRDGSKRTEDDGVKGGAVSILHNGKVVHEFASRGVTLVAEGKKDAAKGRAEASQR